MSVVEKMRFRSVLSQQKLVVVPEFVLSPTVGKFIGFLSLLYNTVYVKFNIVFYVQSVSYNNEK